MADSVFNPVVDKMATTATLGVGKLAHRINAGIEALTNEFKALAREGSAADMARAFVGVRKLKDLLKENETNFGKLYALLAEVMLPEAIEKSGQTHVPLAEGWRVGVSQNMRASIPPAKRQEAWQWLRDNGLGDLITETVNAQTLSSAAKVRLEDQGLDMPEDLFNVQMVPNTSVTAIRSNK